MSKKIMNFELDKKSLKMKDILDKEFVEIEVYAISDAYPNRNGSVFTLDSMKDAISSFANRPILGAWDNVQGDFKSHNGDLKYDNELETLYYDYYSQPGCETPLGLIRESDKVEIVYDEERKENWIVVHAVLWSRYAYNQIKKLLRKNGKSKISVEIEVQSSHQDENGYEILDKWNFTGLTILGTENGKQVEEGIENAHLSVLDLMNNALFQRKSKCLAFAYSALDDYNKNKLEEPNKLEETNKVETPNEVINLEQDSNKNYEKENPIVNESPNEEITMDENVNNQKEGGSLVVLTYEMKRKLLEEALGCWVMDLSDDYVYFEVEEDNTWIDYRAPYVITESEEEGESPKAVVDLEQKERVTKTWTTYSAEENQEEVATEPVAEDNNQEEFAEDGKCPDCGEDPCVCETEACDGKEDEACGDKKEDEACGDKKEDETCKCAEEETDKVEDEAKCEKCEATFAEGTDVNEEPEDKNLEDKPMEAIIADSTASISAPEVQTEAEQLGDANVEAEAVMNQTEVEAAIVDEPMVEAMSEVSEGPAGEAAVVVNEEASSEEEGEVEQPDDDAKQADEVFAAETPTPVKASNEQFTANKVAEEAAESTEPVQEEFVSTVELNGEQIDIKGLLEKYNELNEKYEALNNSVKVQEAKALANFAENFVNADTEVDEESRKKFVEELVSKCESFEFTTEEEVKNCAKGLLAMYYYEIKLAKENKNEEFGIDIQEESHVANNALSGLKSAINKLNHA